ncbi:SUMF1/EgtB/PvdO family nonheme iron enzyme [Cronbergia sp. UHCC 0137]|uniref:bifunctional serine/threonine-protein kinase/formylglycine-generating enzyme family protein n=1 Tax=Cronbergia sp. UHCC 0137 TaxID=3110239 RepID=UPI002B1F0847|nr:SUMF1/EgtB/PvdO family nonheme iron enzyme [Cronbergia sp. UHCC 0137]MEA5618926.1 SUMF1/EgtB/PvdO family nonheme iron enzyme [Cronbergia sp. UHCC 0137]
MSQCLNPDCLCQNPPRNIFCQRCGSKIVLQERYRGVKVIGQGGFGRTFLAVDEHRLNTHCVIKQFLPQQSGSVELKKATELFQQEAVRLLDLGQHPHIPYFHAFFEQEKRLYLIQDFIEGENLLHELETKGKFSESQVKQILIELLPILQFVHENKVIHRDIKPENIIRSSQTGDLFLIDFGISKEVGGTIVTRMGTTAGTSAYAPLEQLRGIVYPNSDLYSLAVTCIRLLTGCLAQTDSPDLLFDSMKMQWIWKEYISVSKELEAVLDKMLQDIPLNRFQSATEVLSALQSREVSTQIITPNSPVYSSSIQINSSPKPIFLPNLNEDLGNNVILEMIAIPGGIFLMGSPENEPGRSSDEHPQHEVTVPAFYLGKNPVTQAQWERVASLPTVKIYLNPKPSYFKGANLPVEQVSWFDAKEFCTRLRRYTGKTYRLPSEAEWEYACRAKTTSLYYFGNTITTDLVNHNNKYRQTTDVETFPPNAFGLYDMHGNVWEWCEDSWHENYRNAPNDGSAWIRSSWLTSGNQSVMRGGSWDKPPIYCRSAYRNGYSHERSDKNKGFRLAVDYFSN